MSLFCGTDLAERIERAEARHMGEAGRATWRRTGTPGFELPLASGLAIFAEPDSPFTKVAGLGFGDPPSAEELDEVERAFAERGAPVQVELAHLGDPEVAALLTSRGYRLVSFENVLGRALTNAAPRRLGPPGIEVRPATAEEFPSWLDVVTEGVLQPDSEGVPAHEEFARQIVMDAERDLAAAGSTCYIAYRDGVVAGGGSVRLSDGVAQLTGAATVPAHRRHGVQTALLAARLADAAAAGCDIAVVTTQPGSRSHHNVQRQGFDLLYTRAILSLPAPRPPAWRVLSTKGDPARPRSSRIA